MGSSVPAELSGVSVGLIYTFVPGVELLSLSPFWGNNIFFIGALIVSTLMMMMVVG